MRGAEGPAYGSRVACPRCSPTCGCPTLHKSCPNAKSNTLVPYSCLVLSLSMRGLCQIGSGGSRCSAPHHRDSVTDRRQIECRARERDQREQTARRSHVATSAPCVLQSRPCDTAAMAPVDARRRDGAPARGAALVTPRGRTLRLLGSWLSTEGEPQNRRDKKPTRASLPFFERAAQGARSLAHQFPKQEGKIQRSPPLLSP